jgi:hypothetical protein
MKGEKKLDGVALLARIFFQSQTINCKGLLYFTYQVRFFHSKFVKILGFGESFIQMHDPII